MKRAILFLFFALIYFLSHAQDKEVNFNIALQYYQQGEYTKAEAILEQLFKNAKNNENYFDLYFNTLLKNKKFEDAEKLVKKLSKLNPQNTNYSIALAKVYEESHNAAEANKIYQGIINNLPKDEIQIRMLANTFYQYGNIDLSIKAFLQGRKIFNNNQLFVYDLVSIYRIKKDKNNLMHEYLEALSSMPQLLAQAENAFNSIFEGKNDYYSLQSAILSKIQKEPNNEVYTQLLIWQFMQLQEYDMALRQLIAQDKRTNNDGSNVFNSAYIFNANGAFNVAIKAYEYLLTKGKESSYFIPSRIELLNTKFNSITSNTYSTADINSLANDYQAIITEYGQVKSTLFAIKKWSHLQAYYLNSPLKAAKALEDALNIPGISIQDVAQIKLDLGDIYILTNQPWEAFLTYEQVSKQQEDQPIGNEARYRSAKLSFYQGNFKYAKSQADVLKASTAQLIANDALNLSLLISDNTQSTTDSCALKLYADAEMLQFQNRTSQALQKLDSISILYPQNSLHDDVLMAKAKIYIQNKQLTQAVSLLKTLIETENLSLWMDDALFTLADLYEKKLNDMEQAKIYFQKLITAFPGSMLTAEARKRFRFLRGDTKIDITTDGHK